MADGLPPPRGAGTPERVRSTRRGTPPSTPKTYTQVGVGPLSCSMGQVGMDDDEERESEEYRRRAIFWVFAALSFLVVLVIIVVVAFTSDDRAAMQWERLFYGVENTEKNQTR